MSSTQATSKSYAPSISSVSSSKPLLDTTSTSNKKTSLRAKTKKLLSSINEPPAPVDYEKAAREGMTKEEIWLAKAYDTGPLGRSGPLGKGSAFEARWN
ncbi:hypothetical protein PVAG01_10594 [Phlyctema vagabunda]|uniref:Uncharacterized protein n=1 Tax=Phlyctema vagabunda TaxID=108571 RepID=A0ABR4P2Q3_9HELO